MSAVVGVSARKIPPQNFTDWTFQFRKAMIEKKIVDVTNSNDLQFAYELSAIWFDYAKDTDGSIWMSPEDALDEELTYWGE